jgi:isopentenyl-diphosphate delta-isomerase
VQQAANWADIQLVHQALPEVNLDTIDTSTQFLGHQLCHPLVISSLTGGHPAVTVINRHLAQAAEHYGLVLGVGSQRAAIVNPQLASSYAVTRENAPNAFIFANIGASQLIEQKRHPAFTIEQVHQAIDMISANALAIHLNSLQEATQPEGDHNTQGQVRAIRELAAQINIPVIIKETGAGISGSLAAYLYRCGVSAIDVGGAGGSSMPAIESKRAHERGDNRTAHIGETYHSWGIPTPIAVVEAHTSTAGTMPIIATGGVRNGMDVARALSLGATLVGMGHPFLKAASESYEQVCELIETTIAELKVAMQLSGATDISELQRVDVVVTGATRDWLVLRGYEDELKEMARRRRLADHFKHVMREHKQ